MKNILTKFLISIFILSIFNSVFLVNKVMALTQAQTNFVNAKTYNNLISEHDYLSVNALSVAQIQGFLVTKNSFLKSYSEGGRSAAQIIWDAAHANTVDSRGTPPSYIDNDIEVSPNTGTVNPMVILVTLQKEQSLIGRTTNPGSTILNKAMGYGCPDGSGCNVKYTGFTKQVDWAAWQLRYNFHRADTVHTWATTYKVGQTMTIASTDYANINVTFSNRCTAALYRYTPHVFNGNYNFWKYFHDYFDAYNIPDPPVAIDNDAAVSIRTYMGTVNINSTRATDSTTVSLAGASISYPDSRTWIATLNPPIGTTTYTLNYSSGRTKQIIISRHKQADINGDGKVNLLDLSIFASNWGSEKPKEPLASLNPDVDEQVNLLDLSILAAIWNN